MFCLINRVLKDKILKLVANTPAFKGNIYGIVRNDRGKEHHMPKKHFWVCPEGDKYFLDKMLTMMEKPKCKDGIEVSQKKSGEDSSLVFKITPEAYKNSFPRFFNKFNKDAEKGMLERHNPLLARLFENERVEKFVFKLSKDEFTEAYSSIRKSLKPSNKKNIELKKLNELF